jgi:phosphatidylserine/phosphatidylglycerophosphate/cardiolipin synthase-like enzyme
MFKTSLFDETTFYKQFKKDLLKCKKEVVIESPFITNDRTLMLCPIFEKLIKRGVNVYIITRSPKKHMKTMRAQAEEVIDYFERLGIQVLVASNNHHRKLAILDREVLWEGSLNILSQSNSKEVMRRIEGDNHAKKMFDFLKLGRFI